MRAIRIGSGRPVPCTTSLPPRARPGVRPPELELNLVLFSLCACAHTALSLSLAARSRDGAQPCVVRRTRSRHFRHGLGEGATPDIAARYVDAVQYNTVAFRVFEPNPGTCFNEASDADAVAAVALI